MIFDYRRRFFFPKKIDLVKIIFFTCFLFTVLVLCFKMVRMRARKTSKEQTGAAGSNQHGVGTNSVSGGNMKKRQQKPRIKRVSWSKSFFVTVGFF